MGNEASKNKELTKNGSISKKHTNGSINGISSTIKFNGVATVETTEPDYVILESDSKLAEAPIISELLETIIQKEEVKEINENQPDVSFPAPDPQTETTNLKQESESLPEPESVTLDPSPEEEKAPETVNGNIHPVETKAQSKPEENSVMNFFKTLVTPKVTKETATPEATKEQSQECPPATTTTVAQVSEPPPAPKGMSIPPPPPPEPPKMEIKAEPAAKPAKPSPKEEPKAAGKSPKDSKGISARATLSNLFRPKVLRGLKASKGKGASASGAHAKTAAVKVDPSKAGTLEAAAKPELPPPVQEEKKTDSKPSSFPCLSPKRRPLPPLQQQRQ
ncbi:breast carcinoma-amplified sequence 1 isoform X13 [Eleginops maclovinus]|uniref:breast carcinoma-amplified sequence 1 isoform X13 n=1 Tax=Eleginops maclovinus TaxID=56733 RepID=UPI0030802564